MYLHIKLWDEIYSLSNSYVCILYSYHVHSISSIGVYIRFQKDRHKIGNVMANFDLVFIAHIEYWIEKCDEITTKLFEKHSHIFIS